MLLLYICANLVQRYFRKQNIRETEKSVHLTKIRYYGLLGTLNQCKGKCFDILPLSYLNKLMLPSNFNGTCYTWVCIFKTIPIQMTPPLTDILFSEQGWLASAKWQEVVCYSLTVQNIKQHNILFTAGTQVFKWKILTPTQIFGFIWSSNI